MSAAHPGESERDDLIEKERPCYASRMLLVIRAVSVFKSILDRNRRECGRRSFGISAWTLTLIVEYRNLCLLRKHRGVEGIAAALETSTEDGLKFDHDIDIARRRKAFGANTPEAEPRSFIDCLHRASTNPGTLLLLVCGVISLGLGVAAGRAEGCKSGLSLLIVVFVVVLFTSVAKNRHSSLLREMLHEGEEHDPLINVVRAGNGRCISVSEIVVGDVVYLEAGDRVPGHGLLLEAHSLQLDAKNQEPFLLSGTKVVDGSARMLVTSVATHLKLIKLITWFQKQLHFVGFRALPCICLGLLINAVISTIALGRGEHENKDELSDLDMASNTFDFWVTIITVAAEIPDPWEMYLIFSRTYVMKKIVSDREAVTLIRPSALETLCSVTTICTNKTGILTMDCASVAEFWLPPQNQVSDSLSRPPPQNQVSYSTIEPRVIQLLRDGIALTASETPSSSTDQVILSWACEKLNADINHPKDSYDIVHTHAFNSYTKKGGIRARSKGDGTVHVHWKGCPESILEMCSTYYDALGVVKDLDAIARREFEGVVQGMAAKKLRCIAFAHKQVLGDEEQRGVVNVGLGLLGVVGLADECHPGVRSAVLDSRARGVNVKMITGDNVLAAKAVAAECGILLITDNTEAVVEGSEFRGYEAERMAESVDNMRLMAGASQDDKQNAMWCLKQRGHIVAFAGDDSESNFFTMVRADVGFIMRSRNERGATDVGDIVVSDGNFGSVLKLVTQRRSMYNNKQKFAQLVYAAQGSTFFASFALLATAKEFPLTPEQLVWLNLVTNLLGPLAFSSEETAGDEPLQTPRRPGKEPFVTNVMMRNILPQALYQATVVLTLFFKGRSVFRIGESVSNTLMFNSFVFCHVFNAINSRRLESKNVFGGMKRMFLFVMAGIVVIQVMVVEIQNQIADTKRLSLLQWAFCVGIGAMSLPIGFVARLIPLPKTEVLGRLVSVF